MLPSVLGAKSKNLGSEAPTRESGHVYRGSSLENAVLEGVAESKNLGSKAPTRESGQVYKGSQLENAVRGPAESKNLGSEAPMRESSQVYKGSQLENAVWRNLRIWARRHRRGKVAKFIKGVS